MSDADVVVIGGGQSGLATAYAARSRGLTAIVLDGSPGPGGSWPHYYDSLKLFSPARFSSLPGLPFPGDPNRYPLRDEVVDYLTSYTKRVDADVRFDRRVSQVTRTGEGFTVSSTDGTVVSARLVVAAGGGFGSPYRPELAGLDQFATQVLHTADYRGPAAFTGARVVVVGGGNSAVQIAVELAGQARVTIATRRSLRWQPQRYLGHDFHWWLTRTGLDTWRWGPRLVGGTVPVIDDGRYRAAVGSGRPDRRAMFERLDGDAVVWADGTRERIDALILATGYRPELSYLARTGALDAADRPLHEGGVSRTVSGLGYVGLERQRSLASATLRGVGRDAAHVLRRLTATPTGSAAAR